MRLELTDSQLAFRDELRDYLDRLMTPAVREEFGSGGEGGGPEFRRAMKQLGADGLLGVSWPKRFAVRTWTTICSLSSGRPDDLCDRCAGRRRSTSPECRASRSVEGLLARMQFEPSGFPEAVRCRQVGDQPVDPVSL